MESSFRPPSRRMDFAAGHYLAQTKSHAGERGVILFDRLHRIDDRLCPIDAVWQRWEIVELRRRLEEDRPAPREVLFGQRAGLSPALWQRRLDFRFGREEPTVHMAQEDQTHHRQKIFVAREIRICAQGIGARPEALFNFSNVFQLSPPITSNRIGHTLRIVTSLFDCSSRPRYLILRLKFVAPQLHRRLSFVPL
jgi:hypothetical protein